MSNTFRHFRRQQLHAPATIQTHVQIATPDQFVLKLIVSPASPDELCLHFSPIRYKCISRSIVPHWYCEVGGSEPEVMATEREQVSKMSEDVNLLKSPITYGDILGAQDKLGADAVAPEDAALMQSAEALTFGHTRKYGAASVMQAAAQENVKAGFVHPGDHSQAAEEGVIAQEILVPGAEIDLEFIAGQPVMATVTPTPTDSFLVASDAITIGDALEAAAVGAGDEPLQRSDARAIQSATQRATGGPPTAGGLAAAAMSAADLNSRVPSADKTTLADILMDASIELEVDKVATQEDAAKVLDAELRGSSTGQPRPGGVAAAVQAAADINERAGFVEPDSSDHARAFPAVDTPVPQDAPPNTSAPAASAPPNTPTPAASAPPNTPAPAASAPPNTPTPAASAPPNTPAPAAPAPANTHAPPAPAPANTPAPAASAPANTPAPAAPAPPNTPAPAAPAPANTHAPPAPAPANTPAPAASAPPNTPAPAAPAPANTPAPLAPAPEAANEPDHVKAD